MSSWRPNQQSKPWPWANAVYLEGGNEDNPPIRGNITGNKYDNPEGQVLDGTVYKNAFPVPGNHYIYKSKKSFRDKYAKNKAKFEKKAKLPPITEAMSEASSKAGSTRSTRSWMIPRYNPDILSDVMASDESDSEDEDYTSGRSERKYRKSGRSNNQPSSLRHVDVIRNIQAQPRPQTKRQNVGVWHPVNNTHYNPKETNHGSSLHRSPMNGDAVLANHLMMNNGSVYKEKHPLGMPQTTEEDNRVLNNQSWRDNTYGRQDSIGNGDISRGQTVVRRRRAKRSQNNCVITCFVIVVIVAVLGAGIAGYLLLRDTSDDAEVTSPPPIVQTVKYNLVLLLQDGNYTSALDDNQSDEFIAVEDEVCRFLIAVPMRERLNIANCEVASFKEGSILANTNLYFAKDNITVLRDRGATESDIIAFIVEDVMKEIGLGSSQISKTFVEKYRPKVETEQPVTTATSTTEKAETDESTFVTPSMTEGTVGTTELTSSLWGTFGETFALRDSSSAMDALSTLDFFSSSTWDTFSSNADAINASSTDAQNFVESSSAS